MVATRARRTGELELPGLRGQRPLDVLAAWGVLASITEPLKEKRPKQPVTLSWSDHNLVPHAILSGVSSLDEVVARLDADRMEWIHSPVLARDDLIMGFDEVSHWAGQLAAASPVEIRLWRSLVSPDPLLRSRNGYVAFTPLRFTSGNQKFLAAARNLALATTDDQLRSALTDGTVRDDTPSFAQVGRA